MNTEIRFEIKNHYGVIWENQKGWKKELNLVSWNDNPAKLDIREWSPEHDCMGKGLTFTKKEAETLYTLLTDAMLSDAFQNA